jgi:hypothetical protein
MTVEPLLLASTQISTFDGTCLLSQASGFFFEREERLYFVTSRHVLCDAPSGHFPNRVELLLHTDATDLTQCAVLSVLLFQMTTACGTKAPTVRARLMWP